MFTHKLFIITLFAGLFIIGVGSVAAAEYVPLVKFPGFGEKALSIPDFINATYRIVVVLGAVVGVIKIAIAGVKYSMSDVITDKAGAKKDILGVLLGLAILLLPWIVLNTIYPNLLNLDFSEKLRDHAVRARDAANPNAGFEGREEMVEDTNYPGLKLYRGECTLIESGATCIQRCKDRVSSLSNFDRFSTTDPRVEDYGAWGDFGTCLVGYYEKEDGDSNDDGDPYANKTTTLQCDRKTEKSEDTEEKRLANDQKCEEWCRFNAKNLEGFISLTSLELQRSTFQSYVYRKCLIEYKQELQ